MSLTSLKNLLLLSYLALFLNLGPALHRAPIFGLHEHGHGNHTAPDCGCGHHHESPDSGHGNVRDQACDDCSLCRFFNHYNVTIDATDDFLFVDRSWTSIDRLVLQFSVAAILKTARGPPTA